MKLAIMQPYFMPYIGYFQLINAADTFVIYDDINFIKQGWINRNRILINRQVHYLSVNLKGASSFKNICNIEIDFSSKKKLKTIYQAYSKAPFFEIVYPIIEKIIQYDSNNLAEFVANSIFECSKYMGIKTCMETSSQLNIGNKLSGQKRIIEICKYFDANQYINAFGGKELYQKNVFQKENIELLFIKTNFTEYKQFSHQFTPGMSIIDIMMFNTIEIITEMLNNYELI